MKKYKDGKKFISPSDTYGAYVSDGKFSEGVDILDFKYLQNWTSNYRDPIGGSAV
jgi:hypothetical protein